MNVAYTTANGNATVPNMHLFTHDTVREINEVREEMFRRRECDMQAQKKERHPSNDTSYRLARQREYDKKNIHAEQC